MNGLSLPRWTVPIVDLSAAVSATSIWWVLAITPTSANFDADLRLIIANTEVEQLRVVVDELRNSSPNASKFSNVHT
jgi:hypothetical protein